MERGERIRCNTNAAKGNALALSMRCASDSYKFDLGSASREGTNISGSWNETSRGVVSSCPANQWQQHHGHRYIGRCYRCVADQNERQRAERFDPVARQRSLRSGRHDGARQIIRITAGRVYSAARPAVIFS